MRVRYWFTFLYGAAKYTKLRHSFIIDYAYTDDCVDLINNASFKMNEFPHKAINHE